MNSSGVIGAGRSSGAERCGVVSCCELSMSMMLVVVVLLVVVIVSLEYMFEYLKSF